VFQLGDAGFVMRLLFLGGVIFRVLRKVAMRALLGDMLDDARTLHRLALLQLDLKGGITASGHRNLFHHLSMSFNFMRTIRRPRTNAETEHPHDGRVPVTRAALPIDCPDAKSRRRDQVSEK